MRSRAGMDNVKMQIELSKPRPRHVLIGFDDDDDTFGTWQPFEYENIPPYCIYYRHHGHDVIKNVKKG